MLSLPVRCSLSGVWSAPFFFFGTTAPAAGGGRNVVQIFNYPELTRVTTVYCICIVECDSLLQRCGLGTMHSSLVNHW